MSDSDQNNVNNEKIVVMNKRISTTTSRLTCMIAAGLLALGAACNTSQAYETYSDGCNACHGDFRGATSPKGTVFPSSQNHEMHRASTSMASACNLCHTGASRTPVYIGSSTGTANNQGLGCSGCHVGPGLREHHNNNGITVCYDCHTYETPVPENVSPPYYGTADTKVKNPGNTLLAANTNENWSVGDFLGLDNDGNNLYDAADLAITPYRFLSVKPEGNNIRVAWQTAGGRKDAIQASGVVNGLYSNVSSAITIPGLGVVTTNYVDIGALTNRPRRFYRVTFVP
jgi:hypothetical protein